MANMAKTKTWVEKKTDSISPKTQHFLYTNLSSIEDDDAFSTGTGLERAGIAGSVC